ncbi:MAG: CAP domain-containing protein [Polyangiaceae bacterium]|nr:CAP domain-containing protein [Polyangiaceae bacterium]
MATQPAAAQSMAPAGVGGWATHTGPPTDAPAPDARNAQLLTVCGQGDAALHRAAAVVALRGARRRPSPDMVQLGHLLRRLGDPHTGARSWSLTRRGSVDRAQAITRLRAWLKRSGLPASRRCGVASVKDSISGEAVAVVVVPLQADLRAPVPTQARVGAWVTVDAVMRAQCSGAMVVVLGPRGAPRTIPTSFDPREGRVVARFMADQPGRWLAQVVASSEPGPLPVLETETYAGMPLPVELAHRQAPGERAAHGASDPAAALFAMLQAARADERLGPLARDTQLDALAVAHARAMRAAGRVGHDVGDGAPPQRVSDAGLMAAEVGENVSHAATILLAHRTLWSSPSHRANMLHPRYERVGVAAVRGHDGTLWVTQLFLD